MLTNSANLNAYTNTDRHKHFELWHFAENDVVRLETDINFVSFHWFVFAPFINFQWGFVFCVPFEANSRKKIYCLASINGFLKWTPKGFSWNVITWFSLVNFSTVIVSAFYWWKCRMALLCRMLRVGSFIQLPVGYNLLKMMLFNLSVFVTVVTFFIW